MWLEFELLMWDRESQLSRLAKYKLRCHNLLPAQYQIWCCGKYICDKYICVKYILLNIFVANIFVAKYKLLCHHLLSAQYICIKYIAMIYISDKFIYLHEIYLWQSTSWDATICWLLKRRRSSKHIIAGHISSSWHGCCWKLAGGKKMVAEQGWVRLEEEYGGVERRM